LMRLLLLPLKQGDRTMLWKKSPKR
jgi:hypothetical protein